MQQKKSYVVFRASNVAEKQSRAKTEIPRNGLENRIWRNRIDFNRCIINPRGCHDITSRIYRHTHTHVCVLCMCVYIYIYHSPHPWLDRPWAVTPAVRCGVGRPRPHPPLTSVQASPAGGRVPDGTRYRAAAFLFLDKGLCLPTS